MEVSLGFIVVITLILFPGLLFRRLYYYGEFSKQFKGGYNLLSLIAVSSIPGIIMLILAFLSYDWLFTNIDLGEIIDKFKDINNPDFRLSKSDDTPIKDLISTKAAPFIGFLYLISFLSGIALGRLIRISGLDTKFKLLRFKNYWFYLFNGQHTRFKKMKHMKKKNKKHLFTKADILIDSNSRTDLYSGIVIDYELEDDNSKSLSKVMLQNAKRYSVREGKRVPVPIPGNLLVVDCTNMQNINLTFIYEEAKDILKSKIPNRIEVIFGSIILILIPIFLFRAESIEWEIYQSYFKLNWYSKIIAFLLTIQSIALLNPFVKQKDEYKKVTWKLFGAKFLWIVIMSVLLWLLS